MSKSQKNIFPELLELAHTGELPIKWIHLFIHPEMFNKFDEALGIIIRMVALIPDVSKGDRVRLVGKLTIKQLTMKKYLLAIIEKDNPSLIKDVYRLGNELGYLLRDVLNCSSWRSKVSIDQLDIFQEFANSIPKDEPTFYRDIEKYGYFILTAAINEILYSEDACKEECEFKKALKENKEEPVNNLEEIPLKLKENLHAEII